MSFNHSLSAKYYVCNKLDKTLKLNVANTPFTKKCKDPCRM